MFGKSDDLKDMRKWRVWKLKLIDARLYFVSIFVGLLTGLVAELAVVLKDEGIVLDR